MRTELLDFSFPPELIATEPLRPSRVLWSEADSAPIELTFSRLLECIPAGDVLILNDTRVLPMRVVALSGEEVLFIRSIQDSDWEVLFHARDLKLGHDLIFPGGVIGRLKSKGLPQTLEMNRNLNDAFFRTNGEPALPPYIQSARQNRRALGDDRLWYQSAWARVPGSSAAPTASLHFSKKDIDHLRQRGVDIRMLTLHVGLGTFLPIKGEDLSSHVMHSESIEMSHATVKDLRTRRVWALGTTVTRALESWAAGGLQENEFGFSGATNLFIQPGYEFKVVDHLLTNFHQPKSTLLALVMAFAGEERVREAYRFAIHNRFRLFSYGDLSAWTR
jgi:S-adenosylmethionine:tRNA ribosyltransferase-isomerase